MVADDDGVRAQRIETIWIEDEYKLLQQFFPVSPVVNSEVCPHACPFSCGGDTLSGARISVGG
jgi:hypothetical protein